jgi:hypothetical protein
VATVVVDQESVLIRVQDKTGVLCHRCRCLVGGRLLRHLVRLIRTR